MTDNFDPIGSKTPTKPKHLQVVLDVYEADDASRSYAASFEFGIPSSDGGSLETRKGNLVPHLTAGQTTAARSFLDALLDKAQAAVP